MATKPKSVGAVGTEAAGTVPPGDVGEDQPFDQPAEPPAGKSARKTREKRVKVTLSFGPEFAADLASLSTGLGVDKGAFVETLCRPLFKGYRRPSIPSDLERQFRGRRGSAA